MARASVKGRMELRVGTETAVVDRSVEAFFEKVVTSFGTGAKIDCPKEHVGKRVYVIVRKRR